MQTLKALFDVVRVGLPLAALVAAGYVVYIAVRKGLPAAWALLKGWFGSAKRDVIALEARVTALEVHLGIKSSAGTSGASAHTGVSGASGPSK